MRSLPSLVGRVLGPAATLLPGLHLLWVGLIDSVGTGLYLAGSAVFFSSVIGLSPSQIGLGLSIASVLGLIAQMPIGWLADRWGAQRVLIVLHLWRALAFAALIFARDFATFAMVAAAIGVGQQALSPVNQALVAEVVGAEARVALMARVRVIYNVGFSVGGLLATIAISNGARPAFMALVLGNAVCCLLAAFALSRLRPTGQRPAAPRPTVERRFQLRSLRDRKYLTVGALNGFLTLHVSLLGVGVPLWAKLYTAAPTAVVGVLLIVNTVCAVLFQVRATRGSDTVAGSVVALQRGGIALVVCCLLFALAAMFDAPVIAVGLLIAGAIALTAGEVLQSAGGWGVSYALAPQQRRGEYLSSFNLGTSAQYVLGPAIVTVGVTSHGIAGWLALAGCFVVAVVLVRPLVARAEQRPEFVGHAPGHDASLAAVEVTAQDALQPVGLAAQ